MPLLVGNSDLLSIFPSDLIILIVFGEDISKKFKIAIFFNLDYVQIEKNLKIKNTNEYASRYASRN